MDADDEFESLATKIYCHNIDEMIQNENGNETEIKSGQKIAVQSNEKLSEYEKIRERNIQERKEMLDKMKIASINAKKCKKISKTVRTSKSNQNYIIRKSKRLNSTFEDPDVENKSNSPALPPKKKNRQNVDFNPNINIRMPENVDNEMFENIADRVSCKKYDSGPNGTSCHQCRQKTSDTKTICRSGHCSGNSICSKIRKKSAKIS